MLQCDRGVRSYPCFGKLSVMVLLVGTKVRFDEHYRPIQVRRGAIGVVVEIEERITPLGPESWVRARFGEYTTPWIEAWRLESLR
jgi:hypothetical protein